MSFTRDPILKITESVPQITTTTLNTGNDTVGVQFLVTDSGMACTGVRFYWKVSGSKNVKVSLWDAANTRLANTTVTVATTGVYEGFFTTPQTLTIGALYRVSAWQTDGVNYTNTTKGDTGLNNYVSSRITNASTSIAVPYYAGAGVTIVRLQMFGSGDVTPSSIASNEAYILEPIF